MHKIFKLFALMFIGLLGMSTYSFGLEGDTRILRFENPHSPLSFGDVCVGDSKTMNLVLHNDGNTSLGIYKIRFHEKLEGAFDESVEYNLTILAGQSISVPITFSPSELKEYIGLVYVESDRTNTGDRSHLVSGMGNNECICDGSKLLEFLNPHNPLDFGNVLVGTNSLAQNITIINNGECNLTISQVRFHENIKSNFNSSMNGSVPVTVEKDGGILNIPIIFSPSMANEYSGLVYIESDKTNAGDRDKLLLGVGIPE